MPLRARLGSSRHCGDASAGWRVIASATRCAFRAKGHARCNRQGCATCCGRAGMARDVGLRLVEWRISTRGATAKVARLSAPVPRRAGMARDVGLRLVEWRISTRAAGPRDRHARRVTHRQQHGSVPPIHRRGVCLCFLAAFGMRSGQLTMRSSRSASATSSSHAPTRPRTEIPAWCTVSESPETSGCHQ